MSGRQEAGDAALPRRVHRPLGASRVWVDRDTIRQVEEFDRLCGPVTVRRVVEAPDNGDNGDGRAEK
jgi:hypothetical protein